MSCLCVNRLFFVIVAWSICIASSWSLANSPTRIKTFRDRDEAIRVALSSNSEWNFSYRVINVNKVGEDNLTVDYPVQIVRLSEKSFFDHDRYDLKADGKRVLDRIGDIFGEFDSHIIVVGHTDDTGTVEYNEVLALRRAETVHAHLIKRGFDPSKLHIIAMGEAQPVADNNTDSGRAFNRRVEFFVADQFEIARLGVEEISPDACHFQERLSDGECVDRNLEIDVIDPTKNEKTAVVEVQTGKPPPLAYKIVEPKLLVPRESNRPTPLVPRGG